MLRFMKASSLWSLRLGFSNKQDQAIDGLGLEKFLGESFAQKVDRKLPSFLADSPKTIEDFTAQRMVAYKNSLR